MYITVHRYTEIQEDLKLLETDMKNENIFNVCMYLYLICIYKKIISKITKLLFLISLF